MKKPRISKKVLETYLQCSRLGSNNCNDIYFAFEDMEQEIARLNKIIDRARHFLELTCYNNERALTFSECNKLFNMLDKEELKEEGKE